MLIVPVYIPSRSELVIEDVFKKFNPPSLKLRRTRIFGLVPRDLLRKTDQELSSELMPHIRKGGWWEFYREVAKKYAVPKRFYHTFDGHIESCLAEFRWRWKKAENPLAVAMALVLHDAVMDSSKSDNEEKTAAYARDLLARMNAPREFIDKVVELILATKHDAVPISEDAKLVVDIDLSILGKNRWRFNRYDRQIRKEYAFVPEEIFKAKRAEILQKFLDRPRIFLTDHFREKYETRARHNLKQLIKKLS